MPSLMPNISLVTPLTWAWDQVLSHRRLRRTQHARYSHRHGAGGAPRPTANTE